MYAIRSYYVVLNGVEIISNRPIPGITGGSLDSKEGEPGPFQIQGDHGPVEFRKFTVTPAVNWTDEKELNNIKGDQFSYNFV